MSGGNLSGVYHFYTMAVTAATMVQIYIYHAKSRLNTPVWGSLRSPKNLQINEELKYTLDEKLNFL